MTGDIGLEIGSGGGDGCCIADIRGGKVGPTFTGNSAFGGSDINNVNLYLIYSVNIGKILSL